MSALITKTNTFKAEFFFSIIISSQRLTQVHNFQLLPGGSNYLDSLNSININKRRYLRYLHIRPVVVLPVIKMATIINFAYSPDQKNSFCQ